MFDKQIYSGFILGELARLISKDLSEQSGGFDFSHFFNIQKVQKFILPRTIAKRCFFLLLLICVFV